MIRNIGATVPYAYYGVNDIILLVSFNRPCDPDSDPLTYQWDFGDGATGPGVSPTHAYTTLGEFTVTLIVSDGTASSAPASAVVTIANQPPVSAPGGPYSGVRNQPIVFNGSGSSDPDGDSLTFAASGLPTGATLSPAGAFSWTPGAAESANVIFTATDCTGLAVSQSVRLSATVQPPPHLAALSQTTGWVGDVLTLSGTVLSSDSVSVRFAGKSASILALSDTSISLRVPKVKKKLRRAAAFPTFP